MKNYGGVMLADIEADAMIELEKTMEQPIPKIPENIIQDYLDYVQKYEKEDFAGQWLPGVHFGFHAEGGHIVYLFIRGPDPRFKKTPGEPEKFLKPIILPEKCRNLKYLREFNVGLAEVPEFLNEFHEMEKISLGGIANPFTLQRLNFANMKSLKLLHLGNNQLLTIPESVWDLTSLEVLQLCNNEITTISQKICRLKSIRILDFTTNQLRSIPECIVDFPNLLYLSILRNLLPKLPRKFERFYSNENYYQEGITEGAQIIKFHSDFDEEYRNDDEESIRWTRIQNGEQFD